jgi:hypothetical protein
MRVPMMTTPHLRALRITALILAIGCLLGGQSFYYLPDMPTAPSPVTGHTHPINNHGYITYLTGTQWTVHITVFVLSGVFLVMFLSVGYAEMKRRQREDGDE